LSQCFNQVPHHEDIQGSESITPCILSLGSSWRLSGQLHAPAALSLGIYPPVPSGKEAGWASELVWTWWQREKSLPLPGIKPWSSSL